jgi:hypothetical protein
LQRASGWALALLAVLLVADSAFLATAMTPAGLVGPMQRLHLWLGGGLSVVLPAFVASHFAIHRRHRNTSARNVGLVVAGLAMLGCVAGLVLWWSRTGTTGRGILLLHEAAFLVAVAAYVLHRMRARVTPALTPERVAAGAVVLLVGGIWTAQLAWPPRRDALAVRPEFFPGLSRARTVDGHVLGEDDLGNPEYCAECHPAIAERWESSTHHFGSLNDPFYAATLAVGQEIRTPDQMKFCGGCHDPALLLTGRMDTHPKPTDPGADAGITCLACHAIVEIPDRIGNGGYRIATPDHYPGFGSDDPQERELGARLIRTKPAQHITSFGPEHLRTAEMCLPCHKAHIPAELNGHRWLAGQNEFDPWFDSGAGGHSARTFYAPGKQKRCQDCHMPRIEAEDPAARDGTVSDHAFLGANTALPRALGDEAWVARNEAFLADVVSVDVGAVEFSLDETPRRWLAPPPRVTVPAGVQMTLDVVVRNRKSGHFFPGGIADLRETWVELTLLDDQGKPTLVSGWLDAEDNVDPDAHRWNAVLLDGEGNVIRVHDVEKATVVLTARRIMLGASDVIRVQLAAPAVESRLQVRMLHRKFPRAYVEFALGADAPAMPITQLAATSLVLVPGVAEPSDPAPDTGPRLRDLGIGHLLRGDTTLAREAATAAAARMPDDPGPPLDLARAALADGALELAESHVRVADGLAPGHPTAAWLLASIRANQGRHAEAVDALDVALAKFPEDRELLVQKADSLFRLERDAEAAAFLEQVLQIDPEHVSAHALLTRIRSEEGDEAASQRHREAWDRVRPTSEDQVVTERARQADSALDRRANLQYVLTLDASATGWHRAPDGSTP